jgi:hypothetical protein
MDGIYGGVVASARHHLEAGARGSGFSSERVRERGAWRRTTGRRQTRPRGGQRGQNRIPHSWIGLGTAARAGGQLRREACWRWRWRWMATVAGVVVVVV